MSYFHVLTYSFIYPNQIQMILFVESAFPQELQFQNLLLRKCIVVVVGYRCCCPCFLLLLLSQFIIVVALKSESKLHPLILPSNIEHLCNEDVCKKKALVLFFFRKISLRKSMKKSVSKVLQVKNVFDQNIFLQIVVGQIIWGRLLIGRPDPDTYSSLVS